MLFLSIRLNKKLKRIVFIQNIFIFLVKYSVLFKSLGSAIIIVFFFQINLLFYSESLC